MSLQDFIKFIFQYYGVGNTGDTPENKGQCVGLIEVWIDTLGLTHVWGNAKDLLNNADTSKFDVIKNTPEGFPQAGDILVYDGTWGAGVGHTGVVVWADANKILLFEQNNPSIPVIKLEGYNGCLGWLRPKNFNIDQQAVIDELRSQRDTNYNNLVSEQGKNNDLNKQITDLQQQTQNLRDAFDLQTKADANTGAQLLDAQHKVNEYSDVLKTLQATDLKTALEAIDALRQPIEKQVQPLQKHTLTLQEALDELIYKRVPQSGIRIWIKKHLGI